MRIQHNIMAMSAYRNYNTNTSALSKNLEKLSSGYKINRAGDDAAGLAISEKMRAQITGLNAAQKNVKDGISLVKTAEGAMQEIQDMLNRMDYLATQSANGTYDNEVDRANLQKEVDALKTEINRIADSANFNGINLLDGSLEQSSGGRAYINGSERIISTVIGDGDNAWEVTGNKTVLDTSANTVKKGSFAVDLKNLQFTLQGSAAATSGTVTLSIGGTKLTGATVQMSKASETASAVATKLAASIQKANATVTINDVKWSVKASGSKLVFTQKSNPLTKDQAKCNFDVSVDYTNPETSASKGVILSASHLEGTQVRTQAVAAEGANMANTVFKLTESDITDGTKIKLGNKEIVIALGADTKNYKAGATNVVDLRNMEVGKINMNEVLGKISKALGSTVEIKGKNNSGAATNFTFNVGVNDGSDGKEIGITIQRVEAMSTAASGCGAYFNSKDRLTDAFKITLNKPKSTGLSLQIGDTSDKFNQMNVTVGDMHVSAMKSAKTGQTIAEIDISTQEGAQKAVQTIRDAINYVSGVRGDLGAVQNRLEHTQKNLSVMAENIQDAESTIRDTDIAEEMMSYTKNNILVQSAQAMLAQANAVPQGVLQLLG